MYYSSITTTTCELALLQRGLSSQGLQFSILSLYLFYIWMTSAFAPYPSLSLKLRSASTCTSQPHARLRLCPLCKYSSDASGVDSCEGTDQSSLSRWHALTNMRIPILHADQEPNSGSPELFFIDLTVFHVQFLALDAQCLDSKQLSSLHSHHPVFHPRTILAHFVDPQVTTFARLPHGIDNLLVLSLRIPLRDIQYLHPCLPWIRVVNRLCKRS